MKKIFKYAIIALMSVSAVSCDAIFDNMEGDLSKMSAEDMVSSEAGMLRILANLYGNMPMSAFSTSDRDTFYANSSRSNSSYGNGGVSGWWSYSQMRSINKFIESLDAAAEKGIITEQTKDKFMGEAMTIRAYCYFGGVRTMGGMPIVEKTLDDQYGVNDNEGLYYERSTEKETWDWVIEQLGKAADLLPETQAQAMRINKYAALALQARVALWAASESKYWNRTSIANEGYEAYSLKLQYMESNYANEYYKKAIEAAGKVINSGKYSLYGGATKSASAAETALQDLFQKWQPSEGILGRSYDSGASTSGNGVETLNGAWSTHQVTKGYLSGTYSVTANYADEFDEYAADGSSIRRKVVTNVNGDEDTYFTSAPEKNFKGSMAANYVHYPTVSGPFENKDARFKAWINYPGTVFRGVTINVQGGMIYPDGTAAIYPLENEPYEYQGTTYYPFGGQAGDCSSFYMLPGDINGHNRTEYSFTIRKFLDPANFNQYTQSPWYDLRYAEVLLTYAEAVAESGQGDAALAKQCLNDVRHRAAFTDDIDLTVENVLHEWKVEFAFENKWQHVLFRRRAFYQGGETVYDGEGATPVKLTLIPVLDLSGKEPGYIFLRSVPMFADPDKHYNFNPSVKVTSYYSSMSNYVNNHIVDNNRKPNN